MTILSRFRQKHKSINPVILRARRLRRVKISDNKTKIIGASESEIQDIKTGLDTEIIKSGRNEKQAKHELRRLGFLH